MCTFLKSSADIFGLLVHAQPTLLNPVDTVAIVFSESFCFCAFIAEIVKSAGGDAEAALKLLIADKLEDLMRIQVDAIKNIKIDKVTVWDNGQNKDGKNATAGFISGMMQSVPPLEEVFSLAGMSLPDILGKKVSDVQPAIEAQPVVETEEENVTEAE